MVAGNVTDGCHGLTLLAATLTRKKSAKHPFLPRNCHEIKPFFVLWQQQLIVIKGLRPVSATPATLFSLF